MTVTVDPCYRATVLTFEAVKDGVGSLLCKPIV